MEWRCCTVGFAHVTKRRHEEQGGTEGEGNFWGGARNTLSLDHPSFCFLFLLVPLSFQVATISHRPGSVVEKHFFCLGANPKEQFI